MEPNLAPQNPIYNFGAPQPEKNKFQKLGPILAVIFFALLIGGVAYSFYLKSKVNFISPLGDKKNSISKTQAAAKKDVMNPLTGVLYTANEAVSWSGFRPLAVMVNNHPDARPQSGLYKADIVYEIVAEGGITRFLAFFLTDLPDKIGPVRSTREYYLVLVKELGDAMLMHIGWSPQALEAIETWPVRSLGRGGATFWRDNSRDVAIEHTAYVKGSDLRAKGLELGWQGTTPFDSWKFKDSKTTYASMPEAKKVTIDFWYAGDFTAAFEYVSDTNTYKRFLGYDSSDKLISHVDNETKQQLEFNNVVVQFATEQSISGDDKNRLTYQLTGSGEALVFIDGKIVKATWSKASRDARTKFFDQNGKEMEFNRGKFWVSIVPDRNVEQVKYE